MCWRLSLSIGLVALGLPLAGCQKQTPEVIVYEPPLELADLAAGLPEPDNGYALLVDDASRGRFSSVLAIARLAVDPARDTWRLEFAPLNATEQAHWSDAVRGLDPVRKPLFLTRRNTELTGRDFDGLCRAAARRNARLLLVYTVNSTGPNTAQVLGVLYELTDRTPLATFHAAAHYVNEDGVEESPNPKKGDYRDIDARYQAQRQFEQHVTDCLRELIELDQPVPAVHPDDKWTSPFIERWWVPRQYP